MTQNKGLHKCFGQIMPHAVQTGEIVSLISVQRSRDICVGIGRQKTCTKYGIENCRKVKNKKNVQVGMSM